MKFLNAHSLLIKQEEIWEVLTSVMEQEGIKQVITHFMKKKMNVMNCLNGYSKELYFEKLGII
jgi:hypothetical protein